MFSDTDIDVLDQPFADIEIPVEDTNADAFDIPPLPEIVDYRVTFAGREFLIDEPDIATIIGAINLVGKIGLRSQQVVGSALKGLFVDTTSGNRLSIVPIEATFMAFASVLSPQDFESLAGIIFFGGSETQKREAKRFFDNVHERDFDLDALLQGLEYRVAQSTNFRKALKRLPIIGQLIKMTGDGVQTQAPKATTITTSA